MFGRAGSVWAYGAVVVLLAALLAGCGGGRDGAAVGQSSTGQQDATPDGLVAPATALTHMALAAGDPAYARFGREHGAGLTQRTQSQGDCLRFNPAGDASGAYAGLAFAIYGFNLTDYAGAAEFRLEWVDAPQPEQLWLGLSDWEHGVWRWFHVPAGDVLALPDPPGLAQFTKSGTGELLAAVVLTGHDPALLRRCGVRLDTIVDAWPQYQHDAQHTGRSKHIGPSTNAMKWKFRDERGPYGELSGAAASPDGHVYAGGTTPVTWLHYLYAFNPDGSLDWKVPAGDDTRCPPLVTHDGTVLVAAENTTDLGQSQLMAYNPDGSAKWTYPAYITDYLVEATDGAIVFVEPHNKLVVLNPDGTLRWTVELNNSTFYRPTPGADGSLFIATSGAVAGLHCYAADGTENWVYVDPHGAGFLYSTPVTDATGTVYVSNYGSVLTALNPDGTLEWEQDYSPYRISTQAVGATGYVYLSRSTEDNTLPADIAAVDHETGQVLWQYATDGPVAACAVASDGMLLIGEGDRSEYPGAFHHLHAINTNGTLAWTVEVRGAVLPGITFDEAGNAYCSVTYQLANSGQYLGRVYAVNSAGQVLWNSGCGDAPLSGSAVLGEDGRVYAAFQSGNAFAINPDGTVSWQYDSNGCDLYGTPALDDAGTLYMPSHDNNFFAIQDGGTLKWNYTGTYQIQQSSVTLGPDGTLYIGDYGQTPLSGTFNADAVFYAISPAGELKWSKTLLKTIHSAATVGLDGTVYMLSGGGDLHAYAPDGDELWAKPENSVMPCCISSSGPDGTLYCGQGTSRYGAYYQTGTEKWSIDIGCLLASAPAIALDGVTYISGYDGNLRAISPDGELLWTFSAGDASLSAPVVDGAGRVYVGSLDHKLYALDHDGSLLWSFTTGDEILTSPAIGQDGTVYIGSNDGYLYAVGPGSA